MLFMLVKTLTKKYVILKRKFCENFELKQIIAAHSEGNTKAAKYCTKQGVIGEILTHLDGNFAKDAESLRTKIENNQIFEHVAGLYQDSELIRAQTLMSVILPVLGPVRVNTLNGVEHCVGCKLGKHLSSSCSPNTTSSSSPFDLVHSDVWGNSTIASMGDNLYYV